MEFTVILKKFKQEFPKAQYLDPYCLLLISFFLFN